MKRGGDGDRVAGPLFPRLHVNDADKGGPRAPPRNKMALYELFSIPSQRLSSDAVPKLPRQAGSLMPSAFSSQGHGHERSVSSPFCAPHTSFHVADKVNPHSVDRTNQNAMSMGLESKSLKHGSRRMANAAGNIQMGVECSSLHPDDVSSIKGSFGKNSEDEEDFTVPTCVRLGITRRSDKDHHSMDTERTADSHSNNLQKNGAKALSSQSQVQSSHGKPMERHCTNSSVSRGHESRGEGKVKETIELHRSIEDSISRPAIREKTADPLNTHKPSSDQKHPSCKLNELNSLQGGSARRFQASDGCFGETRSLCDTEFMEKQVISNGRSESCSKISLNKSLVEPSVAKHYNVGGEKVAGAEDVERTGSPEDADKVDPSGDANKNGTLEDAGRNDDVSESSTVDSIQGVDICPDDVVGLVGLKHFWKARRAIVNQQRIFALQVFELHRLIKVQKLIAASSDLLLEDTSYLHSSTKALVKDSSAAFLVKPHLKIKQKGESHKVNGECATENTESANFLVNPLVQIVEQKDESHKATCNSECPTENTGGNPPHPHEHGKGPISQLSRDGTCSGRVSSFPTDNKSGAWCFHPPGNQWLIPVMSPSEGLIYKPYTGPCPPSAAFMAPVNSGCDPLSVPPVAGDLMRPAFGVPVSHQHHNMGVLPGSPVVAPNYFPAPYALPGVNPLISSAPVDQARPMAGPRPSGHLEQHSWSSCDMTNPKREAISERAQKVQISEDNDMQGSTASCPGDRSHGGRDALLPHHFPIASSVECSGRPAQARSGDHRAPVIRVVPHNPRSATESAARIFRSIQKERQQYDSV